MKRILILLLSVALIFGAVSCKKKGSGSEETYYRVAFNTASLPYEVTPPAVATVKAGETLAQPTLDAEPTAGYVLIWTTDLADKIAYDFSEPVGSDFILYAVEVPRRYTVTYLLERGTNNKNNPTSFTKNTPTITLLDPTGPFGYVFDRWAYYDDPDSRVESIEQGTEGDVVLRAVYRAAEYEITYSPKSDRGSNPTTYTFGTELSLESPSKEGYRFLGYTIKDDPARTLVTTITADFILEHRQTLFRVNGTIYLEANWEAEV